MRCRGIVKRKGALVVVPHIPRATDIEVVMMIVLRVGELGKSGGDVDKTIAQPRVGSGIIAIVSAVALQPVRTKVLNALVIQPEGLHSRSASDANVSLIIVSDCDARVASHWSCNGQSNRSTQATA